MARMTTYISSMTGFAAFEQQTAAGVLVIELRSVNHRYLELQLKIDDQLRSLESAIREQLNSQLGRGKVDCKIYLNRAANQNAGLNHVALQKIADDIKTTAQFFPNAQAVNLLDVLRMPDVQTAQQIDAEALNEAIKTGLDVAIADLIAARLREGEKLREIILARLSEVENQIALVLPLMPVALKNYQEKCSAKLLEALGSTDDERVRQEMVLFAQRIDVDEELGRLGAHVLEVKRILGAKAAAGKRLDFLMQEMNREANTLGSKSVAIETTKISMELKVLIEQMREQIQNIE